MQRLQADGGSNQNGTRAEHESETENEVDEVEDSQGKEAADGSEDGEDMSANEDEGEEPEEVGAGRYPSRSRARVEHYNPALQEPQHRSRTRRPVVSSQSPSLLHEFMTKCAKLMVIAGCIVSLVQVCWHTPCHNNMLKGAECQGDDYSIGIKSTQPENRSPSQAISFFKYAWCSYG